MHEPAFLAWETVAALHQESRAQFGGLDGRCDRGGLEPALAAAENTFSRGGGDLHDIGAAYAFQLAESQGFLDSNKRTAIACAATFLLANGCHDRADDLVL
jgi:death-on-curing protein